MLVRYVALVACLLGALPANASDAIDTRVTFTFADNDILKAPEDSTLGSPSVPNFNPTAANRLFYDDYERRDTGFENLTHLVLYAHKPGFFAGLDTEAALVIRAEALDSRSVLLRDDGSYIRLAKTLGDSNLSLTAFPVTASRLALGYSYDISWGGVNIFKSAGASPGLKLQWDTAGRYAFLGAKTAVEPQRRPDGTIENDTVYGVMGGGGVDVVDELRIEGGAGYFYRGTIDKPGLIIPVDGHFKVARWDAFGGSAQVAYHVGIPIGVPIDFRLYRNDPLRRESFFKQEKYGEGTSFIVQSEVSVLGQTLQKFERPSSTTVQKAVAGDLSGKVKIGKLRLFGLSVYRDLAFLLFNTPSIPSFVDFPRGIRAQPEYFFFVGADYYVDWLYLTPGASFGIQRPAYQRSTTSGQTVIFRNEVDTEILNPGDPVELIFAGKLTGKWDLSEIVSAVGEFQVSYDRNRRLLAQDLGGIPVRKRADPLILGFNVMLQARF